MLQKVRLRLQRNKTHTTLEDILIMMMLAMKKMNWITRNLSQPMHTTQSHFTIDKPWLCVWVVVVEEQEIVGDHAVGCPCCAFDVGCALGLDTEKPYNMKLETIVDLFSDTDRNIRMMFEVLKMKKKTEVECLILNRYSFAQTLENLFALSFLVKDGRVHMYVDETGARLVVPRNCPSAEEIESGVAKNHHFIFRMTSMIGRR